MEICFRSIEIDLCKIGNVRALTLLLTLLLIDRNLSEKARFKGSVEDTTRALNIAIAVTSKHEAQPDRIGFTSDGPPRTTRSLLEYLRIAVEYEVMSKTLTHSLTQDFADIVAPADRSAVVTKITGYSRVILLRLFGFVPVQFQQFLYLRLRRYIAMING